jgi:hypothetical protein
MVPLPEKETMTKGRVDLYAHIDQVLNKKSKEGESTRHTSKDN